MSDTYDVARADCDQQNWGLHHIDKDKLEFLKKYKKEYNMEEARLKELMKEKIEELEVQQVMQKEMLEVLKSEQVPGEAAAQWGMRLQAVEQDVSVTEKYLTRLKKKYL